MASVENPVLGKHYAAKPINTFKSGIVSGPKMQEKFVVYFMFVAAPEESYFQNWREPNPITNCFI